MVRLAEVFRKRNPSRRAVADRHVGIAGKIEVNLQCKRNGQRPAIQRGGIPSRVRRKSAIHPDAKHIGDDILLHQAPNQRGPSLQNRIAAQTLSETEAAA